MLETILITALVIGAVALAGVILYLIVLGSGMGR